MAIASGLITITRVLINDLDSPYTFSNDKVEQSIAVAGYQVTLDYDFAVDYTFDIDAPDISPDPMADATYDQIMIALVTLKAACILSVNRYTGQVGNGLKVRDGDTEVDTTAGFKGYLDIVTIGPCASYRKLLEQVGNVQFANLGKAVVGPYSHPDAGRDLGYSYASSIFNTFAGGDRWQH